jgi:uncharacterized protein YndB with AHSA1/START domain
MPDMFHLIQVEDVAPPATFTALTTREGITGWWTSRAEVAGTEVGDSVKMSFPDAPMTWDMEIISVNSPKELMWRCTGGPAGWVGTHVAWALDASDEGSVVRLDHTGFSEVDDMFRIVTVGWARMLLSLKAYLESGQRRPFFDF